MNLLDMRLIDEQSVRFLYFQFVTVNKTSGGDCADEPLKIHFTLKLLKLLTGFSPGSEEAQKLKKLQQMHDNFQGLIISVIC